MDGEFTPFSQFAGDANRSAVLPNNAGDIIQAQAITFDIMHVARRNAEKFIEDFALKLRRNAHAVVRDGQI